MKKNLKKILAFFCALVLLVTACFTEGAMKQAEAETETASSTTTDEVKPVELYGFRNVTISDFVGTDGTQMQDGTYESCGDNCGKFTLPGATSFDKKLFSVRVKFTAAEYDWQTRMLVGGSCEWYGIGVRPSTDGTKLIFKDDVGGTTGFDESITLEEANMTSFNDEFLLQMSFDFSDDNTSLELGVYIQGELCKSYDITIAKAEMFGNFLGMNRQGAASQINVESVVIEPSAVTLPGYKNITISDFKDASGNQMPTGTYNHGVGASTFCWDGATDFNKVIFSMKVKFETAGYDNAIHFGGKDSNTWNVLGVYAYDSGAKLRIYDTHGGILTSGSNMSEILIEASTVEVPSFVNQEFRLEFSFEYYDADSDGGTDLKLGVYINGTLYNGQPFTIEDINPDYIGTWLRRYSERDTHILTLNDLKVKTDPIRLSGYDTVTISDFQDSDGTEMEAKGYDYDSVTPSSIFSLKDGSTSFNEKLLSMKVKFGHRDGVEASWENRINIPALDGGWGILVYLDASGNLHIDDKYENDGDTSSGDHFEYISSDMAGVTSFIDTPFIFQMSFTDTTSGMELGIYIDGKLCVTYTWTEATTSQYSAELDLTRSLKDAFIVVGDVDAEEFPADPKIMPDSTFEKISFGTFGIGDGTYKNSDGEKTGKLSDGTLHQKILCGKVKFEKNSDNSWFTFRLGGNNSEWKGLWLASDPSTGNNISAKWVSDNGDVSITDITGTRTLSQFSSDTAKVQLIGGEYTLMISMEAVDANADGTSDVKLGVWFADNLYNDEYYYVLGQGDSLGNTFGFNMGNDDNTKITLNSIMEYVPDSSFDRVTFTQFGVEDGKYMTQGADFVVKGAFKKKDNLDKVALCGNIKLEGDTYDRFDILFGSTAENDWEGIQLWICGSTMSVIVPNAGSQIISSVDAGIGENWITKDFDLMLSAEVIDNDLRVGLCFDNSFYKYLTFTGCIETWTLGNLFAACAENVDESGTANAGNGNSSITFTAVEELKKLPSESLEKISLADMVDISGNVMGSSTFSETQTDSFLISGNLKNTNDTFENKVFAFDVLLTGNASTNGAGGSSYQIILGNDNGHWHGLRFITGANGNLTVGWTRPGTDGDDWSSGQYTIAPANTAVSSFINETFNLMVSMERVNNSVKVNLWINKILYDYEELIFTNCASEIGNKFAIYSGDTSCKTFVSLRNVKEYQSNPYYYEEISQYRQSTGYTYPEVEGKTFAGWYTDADYTTTLASGTTSGSAYAKYTDDEVLRVKSQVIYTENDDGTYSIKSDGNTLRFITTVDSLNYYRIGFKYTVDGENVEKDSFSSYPTTTEGKKLANKVYKTLEYINLDGEGDVMQDAQPDAFSWQSMYFKAWNLADVDASQYSQDVTICAYWITKDGTLVRGQERKICVNDSPTENTSSTATIDFLGKDTMPIAGYGIWNNKDAFTTNGTDTSIFPDYDEAPYFQMFADAGVNLINYGEDDYATNPSDVLKQLENGEKYGLGVFVNDSYLLSLQDEESIKNRLALYESKYESFSGIFLVDEPVQADGWGDDGTAEGRKLLSYYTTDGGGYTATKYLNENYFTYMNLFPINLYTSEWESVFPWLSEKNEEDSKTDYTNYITTATSGVDSSVISWDHYPFEENRIKDGAYNYSLYFWNMDLVRTTALNESKPFWAYVQAGSQWKLYNNGTIADEAFDTYYPSESQFNWIVNTSLAFGAQGIQYYPLIQPTQHAYDGENAEYDFEVNGILSAWGGKTQWYYYAQEINKHITEIDEVLMNAKTQMVVYGTGNSKTQTEGLTNSCAGSYGVLSSVSGDALVGYFNYGGKVALYVANNQHWAVGKEDSVTTQEVTLNLAYDYNEIIKYENAARVDDIATTNKQLTLTMEAGEGILLVLDGIQE